MEQKNQDTKTFSFRKRGFYYFKSLMSIPAGFKVCPNYGNFVMIEITFIIAKRNQDIIDLNRLSGGIAS